jgi:hypothetical protein
VLLEPAYAPSLAVTDFFVIVRIANWRRKDFWRLTALGSYFVAKLPRSGHSIFAELRS